MSTKSLLLISQNPDDAEFAREVAQTANLHFEQARNEVDGVELISRDDRSKVILVDVTNAAQMQALESTLQDQIGLFSEKIDPNKIHLISANPLSDTKHAVPSPLFGHFIRRNYGDTRDSGEHYGKIVKATLMDRSFGLANLMKPGVKIQSVQMVSSTQKRSAVDAVRNYCAAAKFNARVASLIANAIDEIIMNAVFDAAIDEVGRPLYNATTRSTQIKLEGKSVVEVQIGYDGSYVGITVIDHFGSLDKAKLLNHISKSYTHDEYKVRASVAGAGLGLARIFQSGAASFFFASEHSQRTEVTLFFKNTPSYLELRRQFQFLSTQFYF